jgi:AcrR family transcriptional regulator
LKRDSEATRRALLNAARELFEEKGFDGATVRAIGERAGVDPALIARYFDNKEGLYIAALADETDQANLKYAGIEPAEIVERMFRRWDAREGAPVARAMAAAELDEVVLEQVRNLVGLRLSGPLAEGLGVDGQGADSQLRAEILLAAVLGICLTRGNGSLETLAEADREEVAGLIRRIAGSMIG